MTRFSDYQIRRFRLIFNQHAEYAVSPATAGSRSPTRSALITPSGSSFLEDPQDGAQHELRRLKSKNSYFEFGAPSKNLNLRLTSNGLAAIMNRFGPSLSPEVIRSIIFRYDTYCYGCLDFDDFLTFLEDYGRIIESKRDDARHIFANRKRDPIQVIQKSNFHPSSHHFLIRALNAAASVEEFVSALKLDDPELFWSSDDSLTSSIRDSGLVLSYPFLNRSISLHIINAENVETFAHLKLRKGEGFVFNSLDPYIKVSLCGKSRQTTALLNTLHPHWDQEITFDISIFPGEAMDVLQWALTQYFEIALYDLNSDGTLAHGELLAHSAVSIAPILFSVQRPLEFSVSLQCCDGFDRNVILNLHAYDRTSEHVAFPKLVDACYPIEQFWIANYNEKMKTDLFYEVSPKEISTLRKPPVLESVQKNSPFTRLTLEEFWEYYESVIKKLANLFPQRNFAVLGLDELNTFRLLPSFLKPLPFPGTNSLDEIAISVSEIPFYTPIHPQSEVTLSILNKLPGPMLEKFRLAHNPLSNAHAKPCSITETRFSRISVPVSFISRGFGTLTDHALLLCSFFLGLGVDAYVAFGSMHERYHAWVVTFENLEKPFFSTSPLIVTGSQSGTIEQEDNLSMMMITEEFAHKENLKAALLKNSSLNIKLWDLYTGAPVAQIDGHFSFALRVHTLFNNKNLWMNIQACDLISRPIFSWDIMNPKAWIPFFTEDALVSFHDILQTFYPSSFSIFNVLLSFPMDDEKTNKEISELIADYRLSQLFIKTTFNESFSAWLSSQIPDLERSRRSRLPYPTLQSTPPLPESSNFVYRFIFLRGRITVQSIFHHIVTSGMVDCSVPGAAITIAVRSFSYSIGIRTVWVGVGYLAKMT